MAIQVSKNGYFEITYAGPYTGLNVQQPEILIPDSATPAAVNFILRNAELRSRPSFVLSFQPPSPQDDVLGLTSFLDVNGVTHTVCFSPRGLWQLSGNNVPPTRQPWLFIGQPGMATGNPVSYRTFSSVLYYTNGGPFLASWDGVSQLPTQSVATISKADAPTVGGSLPGAPTLVGPLSIGGFYLGELDNHILLANVVLQDSGTGLLYSFPNLLWWSANGIPNVWDPTQNTNAGFNPFLDVPDEITGIMTIGIAGYLFRSNGITQFTPTGNGLAPFEFDHLWASEEGIGNVYSFTVAQYGANGYFCSQENIYKMSVNSFTPIGGTARDAIVADLANATGNPVGWFTPALGLGYIYQLYVISIPLGTFTRHYCYSDEDNHWMQWDTQGQVITSRPGEVWTGNLSAFTNPGVFPGSVGVGESQPTGGGGSSGGGGGTGGGGGHHTYI